MEALTTELLKTQLRILFVEDPYRMQTVLDDHARRIKELATAAEAMVVEWEGK
jgi:hypothetical protein